MEPIGLAFGSFAGPFTFGSSVGFSRFLFRDDVRFNCRKTAGDSSASQAFRKSSFFSLNIK
jgi:hypothetical protein